MNPMTRCRTWWSPHQGTRPGRVVPRSLTIVGRRHHHDATPSGEAVSCRRTLRRAFRNAFVVR